MSTQNLIDFTALAANFAERAANLEFRQEAEDLLRELYDITTIENEYIFDAVWGYILELIETLPDEPTEAEENAEIWRNYLRENY